MHLLVIRIDNPYKEDKIENFGKILITHYHYSTGLLSLTLCRPQEYVLITEAATWGKAQEYCRKNHVDLATVQSNEDWTGVKEVGAEKKYYGYAWYGLYNDINSWRWSYQDESLVFKAWYPGEPDNYASGEECVAIASDTTWRDRNCDLNKYFLCSDESENATEKIVLIKNFKTWLEAQQHCRKHYTDLVTIRSLDDNIQATKLTYAIYEPWIGLYRDSWKWSDQANFTSSTQLTAQNLYGGTENCAGIYWNTRVIDEYYCTGLFYFFCGTVKIKQQVIRVQVKASENADDATLRALVLHKLQQTLIDYDVTLTWKKQQDRKVFQKKKTLGQKTEPVINATSCSYLEWN